MKLIGLTGPAGCGKTTLANILIEDHEFTRVKFADPLKDMLRAMYRNTGMSPDDIERRLEGDLKEVKCDIIGCTPRWAMQTLGTDWGRKLINENLWLNLTIAVLADMPDDARIVIDDVRFDNEAQVVSLYGGRTYMITGRGGIEGYHESEDGVQCDLHVNNDSGLEKLRRTALIIASEP